MLKLILFFSLLSNVLFAGPAEDAKKILDLFGHETSLSKRFNLISKLFIGFPYGKGGPLGEGPDGKYDQDPLYRFDTFDCTTYIETIMALALARDVTEFEVHLDRIRYEDGVVDYLKRNHFTDLQWIPFNVKNGYLIETNHRVLPESQRQVAQALINYPAWLRSHKVEQIIVPMATHEEKLSLLEELKKDANQYQPLWAQVDYLPISTLLAHPELLNKISSGSIVNFVRPNWDLRDINGTHQNISHQGLLFKVRNAIHLRHASTSGKVEELPFIDYLKRFENHATLKGIHLMELGAL